MKVKLKGWDCNTFKCFNENGVEIDSIVSAKIDGIERNTTPILTLTLELEEIDIDGIKTIYQDLSGNKYKRIE